MDDSLHTPLSMVGTHVPDLALDNVEEEDCPFVYMQVLNSIELKGLLSWAQSHLSLSTGTETRHF